jgi:hypothetical protein
MILMFFTIIKEFFMNIRIFVNKYSNVAIHLWLISEIWNNANESKLNIWANYWSIIGHFLSIFIIFLVLLNGFYFDIVYFVNILIVIVRKSAVEKLLIFAGMRNLFKLIFLLFLKFVQKCLYIYYTFWHINVLFSKVSLKDYFSEFPPVYFELNIFIIYFDRLISSVLLLFIAQKSD